MSNKSQNVLLGLSTITTCILTFFLGIFIDTRSAIKESSNSVPAKIDSVGYNATISRAYRVIDGDTMEINSVELDKLYNGRKQYGRLACVDAPETGQTPWGIIAARELDTLLNSSKVVYVNKLGEDKYNRALVLVNVDSLDSTEDIKSFNGNVQKELVKKGLAYVYHEYKSKCPIYDELVDLENDAKSLGVGVWSSKDNIPPWIYRKIAINEYN